MKMKLSDGRFIEFLNLNDNTGEFYEDEKLPTIEFSKAIKPAMTFANDLIENTVKLTGVDKVEIEFSIEAGGEGGFFGLTKVYGKGTIKVKLTKDTS